MSGAGMRIVFDSADRQMVSERRRRYWTRAENSVQEVEKNAVVEKAHSTDSGYACAPQANVLCKPLAFFLTSFQLFHTSLSLYFWMKQTFRICDLEGGGKRGRGQKKSLPTSRHRWGAKRLWKPSGKKCVLELDVLMTWTEKAGIKNYVAPPPAIATRLFFCRTWMAPQVCF